MEAEAGSWRSGGASRGASGPCSAAASLAPAGSAPSAAAAGLFSDLYEPGRVPLSSGPRSPIAAEPLGTAEFTPQSRRRAQPRVHAARRGPAERRGTAPARPPGAGVEGVGPGGAERASASARPGRPVGFVTVRALPGAALEVVGARGCARSRRARPYPGGCHRSSRTRGRVYMSWPRASPTDRARGAQEGYYRSLRVLLAALT